MVNNTTLRAPRAIIDIDTPYLRGTVSAVCLQDATYDLLIGNVDGARSADDPDENWCSNAEVDR